MKLTKFQLKQLIKEEISAILNEQFDDAEDAFPVPRGGAFR